MWARPTRTNQATTYKPHRPIPPSPHHITAPVRPPQGGGPEQMPLRGDAGAERGAAAGRRAGQGGQGKLIEVYDSSRWRRARVSSGRKCSAGTTKHACKYQPLSNKGSKNQHLYTSTSDGQQAFFSRFRSPLLPIPRPRSRHHCHHPIQSLDRLASPSSIPPALAPAAPPPPPRPAARASQSPRSQTTAPRWAPTRRVPYPSVTNRTVTAYRNGACSPRVARGL